MISIGSLNPQQRDAVLTLRGPVLILAGAGTGKTRVITHRIAHMVAEGIPPSQILAVTFTNKAAREMQERVSELLPKAKRAKKGEKAERPTVCTFHSLCVRILRRHIEKLGYKKGFVIFDYSDQIGAIKKILSHLSSKGEKSDPGAVLAMLTSLGGVPGRVLIVGCEPLSVEEGMGLSDVVARGVDEAVCLIEEVVARECAAPRTEAGGPPGVDLRAAGDERQFHPLQVSAGGRARQDRRGRDPRFGE